MHTLPDTLRYAPTHEWVLDEAEEVVSVGISDFAQAQLGDVVFIDLPSKGRRVQAGEAVAVIESVKTASDIHSPLSGEIVDINTRLSESPEAVNEDCYAAWLFKLRVDAQEPAESLLDSEGYRQSIEDI